MSSSSTKIPAKILVTSYQNPDLDGISSAVAYAELLTSQGRRAEAVISGNPHPEFLYLAEEFHIPIPRSLEAADLENQFILVDNSVVHNNDPRLKPEQFIEVIDHRADNEEKLFPNAKIQIEAVGACATLIGEKFQQSHLLPSHNSAILLYGGIISNTLNFQAKTTSARDHQMFDWLRSGYHFSIDFGRQMFAAKSDLSGEKLKTAIYGDLAIRKFHGKTIAFSQLEILDSDKLVKQRQPEIYQILQEISVNQSPDFCFLNIIDLEKGHTYFLTHNKQASDLLTSSVKLAFVDRISKAHRPILRKEVFPLISDKLAHPTHPSLHDR